MDLMQHLADLKRSIDRYIQHGVPAGSFLEAVLCNDLKEAMGRADESGRMILFPLVSYLYNDCPGGCWGSKERHDEWMAMDSDERLRLVAASEFGRRNGVRAPAAKEG